MLTWNVIIIATTYPVKIVSPVSCLWGQINRGCTVGKHLLAMLLSPKLHRAQLFCLVFHTPPVIIIPIFYSDQRLPDQVLVEFCTEGLVTSPPCQPPWYQAAEHKRHSHLIIVVSAVSGARVIFLAECKKIPEERENYCLVIRLYHNRECIILH